MATTVDLTPAQIGEIRAARTLGSTIDQLAKDFAPLSRSLIYQVIAEKGKYRAPDAPPDREASLTKLSPGMQAAWRSRWASTSTGEAEVAATVDALIAEIKVDFRALGEKLRLLENVRASELAMEAAEMVRREREHP